MTGQLQREIKQKKDFSGPEEEAFLNLQRTADELMFRAQDALKPAGISHTQYNLLRILRGAGKRGLACREVGDRMLTHDPDITRLLDRLEKRKLIRRSRDRKDRRVVLTQITPQGRALLARFDRPVAETVRQMLQHLGPRQLRTLTRLLESARSPCR
jgi:DNA-binding MarR family transcriptional regulator